MKFILKTNKKNIYLFALLLTVVLYISCATFRTISSRIALLFTSNSLESIIGYLNSYNTIKLIVSIGLMVLQAIIIPFKYEIMIFANIKVFGVIIGSIFSAIGRFIGAYICFDIGKVLLSKKLDLLITKIDKNIFIHSFRNNNLVHTLIRFIPLNFDLISYLAGILGLNLKKYMINSTIWIILTTVIYSIKIGYYSYSYEFAVICIRLILSLAIFCVGVKIEKKCR